MPRKKAAKTEETISKAFLSRKNDITGEQKQLLTDSKGSRVRKIAKEKNRIADAFCLLRNASTILSFFAKIRSGASAFVV